MSPGDVCGPQPIASGYTDPAEYVAAVAKWQACLIGIVQPTVCGEGEYFAGQLISGQWFGHCVNATTGQPTTADFAVDAIGALGGNSSSGNPTSTAAGFGAGGAGTTPKPAPVTPAKPPASSTTSPHGLQAHNISGFLPGGGIGSYCDLFPDDPTCDLWGNFGQTINIITGGPVNQTIVNYQAGLLAADVHQIVNEALGGLWNAVVSVVDIAFGGAIAGIQNAVTGLGNALKAAWNILSRLAGLILQFLGKMWFTVIHGLVLAIQDITSWLKDLYDNVLKPMIGILQKIRQQLLDIYRRFIRPMVVVIEDVRRVLRVLAAFHVPFAAKLDAKLADLERRITAPFLTLLSYVNQVANWLNLLVTARYLLQRSILLNSIKAYVGALLNLQMNAMTKPLSTANVAQLRAGGGLLTTAQSTAAGAEYIQFGTGPHAAIAEPQTANLKRFLYEGF